MSASINHRPTQVTLASEAQVGRRLKCFSLRSLDTNHFQLEEKANSNEFLCLYTDINAMVAKTEAANARGGRRGKLYYLETKGEKPRRNVLSRILEKTR